MQTATTAQIIDALTDDPTIEDRIIETKMAELAAEGVDLLSMDEAELKSVLLPRLTEQEKMVIATAAISDMVAIEIGRRIVECLDANFKVHRPDIAPCVTAYLEDLARQAEGGAQ